MDTKIQVIDLCGREAPFVADLECLDERIGRDNVEYILDTLAEFEVAYIGEFEYREAR